MFVNISKISSSFLEFCNVLLEDQNVVVIFGIVFGVDDYIWIFYVIDLEIIEKGMDRLEWFI